MDKQNFQLWGEVVKDKDTVSNNNLHESVDVKEALQLLEMQYQPELSVENQIHVYSNSWCDKNDKIGSSIAILTNDEIEIICKHGNISKKRCFDYKKPKNLANMIMFTENFYNKHDYILSFDCLLVGKDAITAAKNKKSNQNSKRISEKDRIQQLLVRCRSSNIWSYGIDIQDRKSGTGNMYIQFKGKNGGPDGGLYEYYDVPINVYRKFISGTSRGSSFWRLIRNDYKYSKLTGDKKGKLPNAINY